MSAPVAERADELGGAAVRRFTHRAAAARADIGVFARIGDALGYLVTAATVIGLIGGSLASLHQPVTGASRPATATPLPVATSAAAVGVLALAGLLFLLDRLGPVSSTPAAAAWWLPLPAGRRGLLAPDLFRTAAVAVTAAVLTALPFVLALPATPTAGGVLLGLGWAAVLAALAVAAAAVLQTRGLDGRLAPFAGGLAVVTATAAAALGTVATLRPGSLGLPAAVPGPGPAGEAAAGGVAVVAAALLGVAVAGLDRLSAGRLRARGAAGSFAAASVLSLDTRDLGRALAGRQRTPRRTLLFRRVSRPWQAVVAGDLAVLARGPVQLAQLAGGVVVPVLVARTQGLGRSSTVVWLGCLAGWALAAVAVGRPARAAQAAPVLDRLLPLSAADVLRARFAVPLALTAAVCGLTGLLLGVGTASPGGWAAMGLATAPAWAAAALRGAYRPDLDWSGQLVSTPMGPVPAGVMATLVQGIDAGLLGSVPLVVALGRGEPTAGLAAGQLVWSVVVAAGVLALLVRRQAGTRADRAL